MSVPALSVVVPTRNRSAFLARAIESIDGQNVGEADFEILVVDNGSTDDTAGIVGGFTARSGRVRYLFEERPGLYQARHCGARAAEGEVLVYVDDDIVAADGWLQAVGKAFEAPDVALVGGRILPLWEGPVPDWVGSFEERAEGGTTLGYLSLLDLGDRQKRVSAGFVYGCNFSIRRSVLYECGGFHPDAMPQELTAYRGDGESALAAAVEARGHSVLYVPEALVYHRIPAERLTVEYFCRRAFNQGVSNSFADLRRRHGLPSSSAGDEGRSPLGALFARLLLPARRLRSRLAAGNPVVRRAGRAREDGFSFHRRSVEEEPRLLEFVLRQNYLDG